MSASVRYLSSCLLLMGLTLAVTGCQLWDTSPGQPTGTGMDMFAPTTMRIHPLTRFQGTGNLDRLLVHLEVTDQFADPTKGVGAVQLTLHAFDRLARGGRGAVLQQWSFDLTAADQQPRYWDPITRTYVFKFDLPDYPQLASRKAVISATFTAPGGKELTDSLPIEPRPTPTTNPG